MLTTLKSVRAHFSGAAVIEYVLLAVLLAIAVIVARIFWGVEIAALVTRMAEFLRVLTH